MTEWIISANSEMYDHSSSFEHFGFIDWRQGNTKYKVKDIVYIYSTRPTSSVRYKCCVEKINLKHSEIRDDKEYWKTLNEYEKSLQGKFTRLRLIEQVSNRKLNLENLKENGLTAAPQGPVKIKKELSEYLKIYFTDDNQTEYFPELINDASIFEGLKKTVVVNRYERSSIARDKCIEFNGLDCFVCEMNFQKVYGEVGKGFIHVHHLTPIHQIGKEYKVNYKEDLVPVCPNCHAMLHRKLEGKELTITDLKSFINK